MTRKVDPIFIIYGFGQVFIKKLDKTYRLIAQIMIFLSACRHCCCNWLGCCDWLVDWLGCCDWLVDGTSVLAPGTNTGPDIGPGHNIILSLCSNRFSD